MNSMTDISIAPPSPAPLKFPGKILPIVFLWCFFATVSGFIFFYSAASLAIVPMLAIAGAFSFVMAFLNKNPKPAAQLSIFCIVASSIILIKQDFVFAVSLPDQIPQVILLFLSGLFLLRFSRLKTPGPPFGAALLCLMCIMPIWDARWGEHYLFVFCLCGFAVLYYLETKVDRPPVEFFLAITIYAWNSFDKGFVGAILLLSLLPLIFFLRKKYRGSKKDAYFVAEDMVVYFILFAAASKIAEISEIQKDLLICGYFFLFTVLHYFRGQETKFKAAICVLFFSIFRLNHGYPYLDPGLSNSMITALLDDVLCLTFFCLVVKKGHPILGLFLKSLLLYVALALFSLTMKADTYVWYEVFLVSLTFFVHAYITWRIADHGLNDGSKGMWHGIINEKIYNIVHDYAPKVLVFFKGLPVIGSLFYYVDYSAGLVKGTFGGGRWSINHWCIILCCFLVTPVVSNCLYSLIHNGYEGSYYSLRAGYEPHVMDIFWSPWAALHLDTTVMIYAVLISGILLFSMFLITGRRYLQLLTLYVVMVYSVVALVDSFKDDNRANIIILMAGFFLVFVACYLFAHFSRAMRSDDDEAEKIEEAAEAQG